MESTLKLRETRQFGKELAAQGRADHQRNMLRRVEAEKAALRFELTQKERSLRVKQASTTIAAAEVEDGIEAFERTLRRVGADASSKPQSAVISTSRDLGTPTSAVKSFMHTLRSKKEADDDARRERERRRRRVLVTQQTVAQQAQQERDEELLLATLVRASAAETALAEDYMLRRRAKEEMRLRRAARDQMYRERRDRDFEDHLAREAEAARRLRAEYEERVR